jgi:hypothetical protein
MRAPWSDEASLLRNLKIIDIGDAFYALPLFDQASPLGATLALKAFAVITDFNFPLMRLALLLTSFYLIYLMAAAAGINKAIPFVLFWLSPALVQYSTELKQYSFELMASYVVILTILLPQRWWLQGANALALLFSFGAIIEVAAQILLRAKEVLERRGISVRTVGGLAASLAVLAFFYLFGKHLTDLNTENYHDNAYKTVGLPLDIARLVKTYYLAHGPLLLISAVAVLVWAWRTVGWRELLADRMVQFLLVTNVAVVVLRLIGLYPAVAPRHIIWTVPITICVVAIWIARLSEGNERGLRWAMVAGLALGIVSISRVPMEVANDRQLFAEVANLPPGTDVLLNLGAQGSVDLYTPDKQPGLLEHRFHGRLSPVTGPLISEQAAMEDFAPNAQRPGVFGSWTYFEKNHDYRPLWKFFIGSVGAADFYIANSHQTPIGSAVLDGNAQAMAATLTEKGCKYESRFTSTYVELLHVECSKVP